jgi:alpha-2-macroglobulin
MCSQVSVASRLVAIDGLTEQFTNSVHSSDVTWGKKRIARSVIAFIYSCISDGLPLAKGHEATAVFEPQRASVGLPSAREVQLLHGRGRYPVTHVNVAGLRVRAREVPPEAAARVAQAYQTYENGLGDEESRRGYPLSFELIPGKVLFDREIEFTEALPVNRSGTHEIVWSEWLGAARPAALFLEVTGVSSLPGSPKPVALSQSFVQVSDLGLAWKSGEADTLVFVFSHREGSGLAGVEVRFFDKDGEPAGPGATTDADGLARLPTPENATQLLARRGADFHLAGVESSGWAYSPWRLGAGRFAWDEAPATRRAACLITDRDLYRPGETVRLAALVRGYQGHLPVKLPAGEVKITCYDSSDRVFFEHRGDPDELGLLAVDVPLPPVTVGYFRAQVELPADGDEDHARNRTFARYFQVQEFRRNAFEVAFPMPEETIGGGDLAGRVEAGYYLGAPVAGADFTWTAHFSGIGFYPDKYRDWYFGDHREPDGGYWSHYFGLDSYYSPSRGRGYANGEGKLGTDGAADLAIAVPADSEFPGARRAFLTVEVTDAKQQTLSAHRQLTIHPAAFYLGVQRPPELVREGQSLALDLVAVDPAGEAIAAAGEVKVEVARQIWSTVEVRQAGGGTVRRNESHFEPAGTATATLTAGRGRVEVAFAATGFHQLAFATTDEAGRPVRTTVGIHVHGKDFHAWEGQQGVRIDLLPDKRLYQPGDTAKLLVKTPLQGLALVTVERDGVERAFTTRLEESSPVIEVPLSDLDAPNTHVGVMVLEGTAASGLKHPLPRARFGYATLQVAPRLPKLLVEVEPARPSIKPGTDANVLVKVSDHEGKPVRGCALVVYAVDEGVLAVAGYDTPDPLAAFHPERLLRVRTSATLENLLAEDPEMLEVWNKGYLVGGGGETEAAGLRKDFRPTAFWAADLRTDTRGEAAVVFKVPDTLTRYRLIALAAAPDFWRFGGGIGSLEVNKPVMVEPAPPRFAHVGDAITVRAQVFNRTDRTGWFTLSLKPDSMVTIESSPRADFSLAPGESRHEEFIVRFNQPGQTNWRWQVEPVRFDPAIPADDLAGFADAVQSTLEIVHPVPPLREIESLTLEDGNPQPLLANISPILRAGTGEVLVSIANTRLVEGFGAMRHLLGYPYGCAEQTASGLVPWLAADRLREMLPDAPPPDEVKRVVAGAVARLASMQTGDGGLGYWPEAGEPDLWASCHAAQVMVLARAQGFDVPEPVLAPLLDWLATRLEGLAADRDAWGLAERARVLLVLAQAGRPDAGSMNRLFERRDELAEDARLNLSLAFAAAGDLASARTLLEPAKAEQPRWWYPDSQRLALRLRAVTAAGLPAAAAEAALDEMLLRRGPEGHWDSTFSNAWSLLAMAAYHETYEKAFAPARVLLEWGGQSREFALDARPMKSTVAINLRDLPADARPVLRRSDGQGRLFATALVVSRPPEMPRKRVSPAFAVDRSYQRVEADGTLGDSSGFEVGDMVAVTLTIDASAAARYLAVDDPLPATFEAVNPDFASQAGSAAAMANVATWASDHSELRDDRAVFFANSLSGPGKFRLVYLARVTRAGNVFAPPPKVEAMYDPTLTALGEGHGLRTFARGQRPPPPAARPVPEGEVDEEDMGEPEEG